MGRDGHLMKFGDEILMYRAENNLTQKEMAGILGVTTTMVNRYENNICMPNKVNLIKFKKILQENKGDYKDV